jgi:hypothetical protein
VNLSRACSTQAAARLEFAFDLREWFDNDIFESISGCAGLGKGKPAQPDFFVCVIAITADHRLSAFHS